MIYLAAATEEGLLGQYSMPILMVGMFVVMYFFMIRPQQKKQKEQKQFREGLKKGDSVMTIGGIYGKVYQIDDAKVVVEIDKGVKITLDKSSISGAADAVKK